MASQVSNKFRTLLAQKIIDFTADTFKIIIMAEGFVFNPDTHAAYADVSASQLANGFGYLTGGNTLAGVAVTQNDTTNTCVITWNNTSWTAAAGDIGPGCGAIIYDDTVATPTAKPLVGFIDFAGSYTEPDGGIATIANPRVII